MKAAMTTRPLAALPGALLCATLAAITPAAAQSHHDKGCSTQPCTTIPGVAPIYAYLSAGAGQYALSVNSATALTPPSGATIASIVVEGASVRYKDDGGTPTASSGMLLTVGGPYPFAGPLNAILFIGTTSGATIDVSYYYSN
jgi:hypothetical protein